MIYLDNAATTAIAPEVLNAMLPYLWGEYGNPGSVHAMGRRAAEAVANARQQVADFLNCDPEQVIFTAGGSEANNLAIKGLFAGSFAEGMQIISDSTEHDSVRKALRAVGNELTGRTIITPTETGVISDRAFKFWVEKTFRPILASIMYVNNEVGSVNPVVEIGEICKRHTALFHVDAVQAAGSLPIDVKEIGCDFLSISSHKIHGPKGVGALYARDTKMLMPLINGGSEQEWGVRAGTENVAGIVGFGAACKLAQKNLEEDIRHISLIKQLFYNKLLDELKDSSIEPVVNGCPVIEHGKILNITFPGVDGESLLLLCDARGVCISAGSACTAHEQEPSHVLKAMGLSDEDAHNSVRISFSRYNTVEEAEEAASIIAGCAKLIRSGVFVKN